MIIIANCDSLSLTFFQLKISLFVCKNNLLTLFKTIFKFQLTLLLFAHYLDACQFPTTWTGLWFQKGVNTIQINQRNISEKGECIDQTNYNYVLENR